MNLRKSINIIIHFLKKCGLVYGLPLSIFSPILQNGILSVLFLRGLFYVFLEKIVRVIAGIPLYICAAASTPIAAALIAKGMSPGTALVFLLSGPATNIATIVVIGKTLGKKATAIYLGSISVCSIALGIIVDYIYFYYMLTPKTSIATHDHDGSSWIKQSASALLFILIIVALYKEWKEKKKVEHQNHHH